jgi:hypothetical protein
MKKPTAPLPEWPVRYRLRLQGRITYDWSDWMSEVTVEFDGEGPASQTVVIGTVRDQPALFGLLSLLRNLGIWLVSMEIV